MTTPHALTCYGPGATIAGYQLLPASTNVGVTRINMTGGGNYAFPPTVSITGATQGSGAQLKAMLKYPARSSQANNPVAFVYIVDPGGGYKYDDEEQVAVSFSGGGGSGASATAEKRAIAAIKFPIYSVDFSFQRKTVWATKVRRYKDQTSLELMPYQAVAMYEFTLHSDRWKQTEVDALEAVADQTKGAAFPMWMTAPDDGQIYNVRFKEDPQGYSVPNAVIRTGDLNLVTIGDIDNSIDNSEAYPPPVRRRRRS